MKLILSGEVPINRYYVQMLCMIYFPGVKFSENESADDDGLSLSVSVSKKQNALSRQWEKREVPKRKEKFRTV